jgi:hypothetical protein
LQRLGADTPDLWDEDTQVSEEGYLTDLFGDRAVKVISDHARAGQSFFLSSMIMGLRATPL